MPLGTTKGEASPSVGSGDQGLADGIDRRSFIRSAMAVGGLSAIGSLTSAFGDGILGSARAGDGSDVSVVDRWNRQHAWGEWEATARGTTVPPALHLLLHLNLTDDATEDGTPTAEARQQVTAALDEIENNFDWHHTGVMFTIGYSKDYFNRYDEDLPGDLSTNTAAGLIDPAATIDATDAPHEDPSEIEADRYDAVLHLASDSAAKLLAVEYALWDAEDGDHDLDKQGDDDVSASVPDFDSTFEDVFTRPTDFPDRRVAFAGESTIEEEFTEAFGDSEKYGDVIDAIPEGNDTSMGLNPLYKSSVPREDAATMTEDQTLIEARPPGMFAQGSIEHVSHMFTKLDLWYGAETGDKPENDQDQRRKQMLSPWHTEQNTGVVGEDLGNSTGIEYDGTEYAMRSAGDTDLAELCEQHAKEEGFVGHAQKLARARFDMSRRETGDLGDERDDSGDDFTGHDGDQELEQPILRRDVPTADAGRPGVHFVGLMRFNGYFHYMRQAMNGGAFDTKAFGLTGDDRIDHDNLVDMLDEEDENGIVPYLLTQRRGNYLVPPITVRGLPPARAVRPGMTVADDNTVDPDDNGAIWATVDLSGTSLTADSLRYDESMRFGQSDVVNRGAGSYPEKVQVKDDDTVRIRFDNKYTGFRDEDLDATGYDDDGDDDDKLTARLFARTAKGYPVRATAVCDEA